MSYEQQAWTNKVYEFLRRWRGRWAWQSRKVGGAGHAWLWEGESRGVGAGDHEVSYWEKAVRMIDCMGFEGIKG